MKRRRSERERKQRSEKETRLALFLSPFFPSPPHALTDDHQRRQRGREQQRRRAVHVARSPPRGESERKEGEARDGERKGAAATPHGRGQKRGAGVRM